MIGNKKLGNFGTKFEIISYYLYGILKPWTTYSKNEKNVIGL